MCNSECVRNKPSRCIGVLYVRVRVIVAGCDGVLCDCVCDCSRLGLFFVVAVIVFVLLVILT